MTPQKDSYGLLARVKNFAWLLFWYVKGINPFWAKDLLTEIAFARLFIHEGDTVLDIGANVGEYSFLFRTLVGEKGAVLAFEPNPIVRRIHYRNMKRRNLTNVRVYPYALSSSSGKPITLRVDLLSTSGISSVEPALQSNERMGLCTYTVSAVTAQLDDFLREDNRLSVDGNAFSLPTFMKVDVEGHETAVFLGGTSFLRRCRPVILFEHRAQSGESSIKSVGLLEEARYAIIDIGTYERIHEPYHIKATRNLLAVPQEKYHLLEPVIDLLRRNGRVES